MQIMRGYSMLLGGRSFSGHERNVCFLNTGAIRFADVSAVSGLNFDDDARSLGVVDWDLDGDLDLWIANRSGPTVRVMRNDCPTDHGWVALRLRGKGANPDAIGARVRIDLAGADGAPLPPVVRALRAGEGYLGQSSKWVHAGVPRGARIVRVTVRWPGGAAEEFRGVAPNARWELAHGTGAAVPWQAPARTVALAPAALAAPRESAVARGWLAARVPVPDFPYTLPDGGSADARRNAGTPRLINLWSSGCKACGVELREFTRHADELRAAGLDVLALNIEAAHAEPRNDPERAKKMLAEMAFPFSHGFARAETLDRVEMIVNQLYRRQRPLVLPTSLLLDREGNLAAIYHGPVELDVLTEDVRHLPDEGPARLAHAVPFPGRWHHPVVISPIRILADKLYVDGELDHARRFYDEALRADPKDPLVLLGIGAVLAAQQKFEEAMKSLQAGLSLDPAEPILHEHMGLLHLLRHEHAPAEKHFRRVLELLPDSADAHFNLATLYRDKGDADRALAGYREVLARVADHAEAHMWTGIVLSRQKKLDEGLAHLKLAVKFAPEQPEPHYYLGASLGVMGRLEEAMEQFQTVIRINPEYPGARQGIQWLEQQLREKGR